MLIFDGGLLSVVGWLLFVFELLLDFMLNNFCLEFIFGFNLCGVWFCILKDGGE